MNSKKMTEERLDYLWSEAVKDHPDLNPSDIRELIYEIRRLQEYEWKYKGLEK